MKPNYSKQLKDFEKYLKKFPEIIAIYYTGSTAKQSWDKYSDIDIDIVVKDRDFEKICKKLPKLLGWWGEVKFYNNYRDYTEVYAYIGDSYLKVEIDPIKKSWLKGWLKEEGKLKGIKIVFDKERTLTREARKSKKLKKKKVNHKEIVNMLLEHRDSQFYTARHFMKGLKFSAFGEIGVIRGSLFQLLAKIKGMTDYELVRTAEKNLTKKEKQMLEKAKLNLETKNELRRAMKANWRLMKYTENLYEKKTKRKLNLRVDDKEILKKIDDIFKGK